MLHDLLRRAGAENSNPAGRQGIVVGESRLAEQGFGHPRGEQVGNLVQFRLGADSTPAGEDRHLGRIIQYPGRTIELVVVGHLTTVEIAVRYVFGAVPFRAGFRVHLLNVIGDGEMGDAAAGKAGDIFHVRGITDMRIVDRDVVEDAGQVDILLRKGLDQVVILRPGDGKHRHLIELGIIKTRQQMRAARSGRCKANAEISGEFGVRARHESGRFLMPDLNEADVVLALAQRLHDPR